jgi:hypothetical protein
LSVLRPDSQPDMRSRTRYRGAPNLPSALSWTPTPVCPHLVTAAWPKFGPYYRDRGGPGGGWIIDEPEIHFVRDKVVLVPDLTGWRRERMPEIPRHPPFEVVPDWI